MRLNPTRGRGIWIYLMAAAGAIAVALSWMVPEPQTAPAQPSQQIAPISFTTCTEQAPPNYGTRALANGPDAGGCTR